MVLVRYGAPFDFVLLEARTGATPLRVVGVQVESYPDDVTPDGHEVTYTSAYSGDVRSVPLDGTGPGKVLLRGARAWNSALSPVGRWLAYRSSVGGQPEVFVERVGGGVRRLRLALNWTPESERLLEGAGKPER